MFTNNWYEYVYVTFQDPVIIGGACKSFRLHSREADGYKVSLSQRKSNIKGCYMTD
jgi:hypothetical protein